MPIAYVSAFCPDRTGLVAAVTGCLFDLGVNLGDSSFAVLGSGAEFTSLCDLPEGLELDELRQSLAALPELAQANLTVRAFDMTAENGALGRITHRITVSGGDRPGLVARLSEVFGSFGANIVRMDAQRIPERGLYTTRFAVAIPERIDACLATVANTAGELHLDCHIDVI